MTCARRTITILDAIGDRNFLRRGSASARRGRVVCVPCRAIRIADDGRARAAFQRCTGRSAPPTQPATEAWLICGRRAGKSFILALVAVFLACFHDYRSHLSPGERGTVMVIACDRRQARVIFRYIRALLTKVPMLAKLVERETADGFDLANGVSIEVNTASFRSVRGYAIVAALIDEVAFLPSDNSALPDYELLAALAPAWRRYRARCCYAIIALRAARRAVERTPKALRQGRRPDTGVAGRHAHDEPDRAAARDRRGHGARPGQRGGRVPGAVSQRHRELRQPRGGRGLRFARRARARSNQRPRIRRLRRPERRVRRFT